MSAPISGGIKNRIVFFYISQFVIGNIIQIQPLILSPFYPYKPLNFTSFYLPVFGIKSSLNSVNDGLSSYKGSLENVHGNFVEQSTVNFSLRIYCVNSCHCSASSNKDNFSPICWPFSDISKTANFPCHHLPSIFYTNNTNKP